MRTKTHDTSILTKYTILVWDLRRYPSLCCSGSERRRICTPKWATPHLHFGFGLSEIIHQHSCLITHQSVTSVKAVVALISQSRQSKAVVARGAVAACNGAATRSGRPRQPTHHAQWEAIAHDRVSRRKQLAAQMGGRQNPTHTGAAQTPYTSALARCGRRSPLRLNQERRRGHERLIRVDKFTSRMRSLSARTPKKVFLLPALALRRLVVH